MLPAEITLLKFAFIVVLVLYALALSFIFLYSLAQANLLYLYIKSKRSKKTYSLPKGAANVQWAFERNSANEGGAVTVQLPIYNELYVVERLIDAVARFNYPKEKFEIQVLDDSTDETTEIVKGKVNEWKENGVDIVHIRRENREGFKAGALKNGLEKAKGDFIAVFDADFIPLENFLQNTIPYFTDEKIGMVQTRWEHINRNYSLLTYLQAFGLDAHFSIEQVGRNAGGSFINFNGTGGIWRKECIIDAGNWESDTLTEDLDLSYRAQLKGWKFQYLEDVGSPAELPPVMSALKSQQYRWTKGGAETAKKHVGNVLKSKFPLSVKWHALFHLLNSAVFISIIVCAITSIPLLLLKPQFPQFKELFWFASLFLVSFVIIGILYYVSYQISESRISTSNTRKVNSIFPFRIFRPASAGSFFIDFPFFLSVSMGLSLHNAIAVIEGYIGRKTPFIRTPKFNIQKSDDSWKENKYLSKKFNLLTIAEGLLALYFSYGIYQAFKMNDFGLLPFHLMLTFGFGTVFYYSVFQNNATNQVLPNGEDLGGA